MIEYDKLIKDKIPEIIEQSRKKCIVEVMDNDTYIEYPWQPHEKIEEICYN